MRRFHVTKTVKLNSCNYECPNWQHHDGMGHCEDWYSCEAAKPDIIEGRYLRMKDPREAKHVNGFPTWCPLLEI